MQRVELNMMFDCITEKLIVKKPAYLFVAASILFCIFSCQRDNYRDIDYSRTVDMKQMGPASKTADSSLTLAVASIISASESFSSYRALAGYLHLRCGRKVSVVHPQTYQEIIDLFAKRGADIGAVCAGPYVVGRRAGLFDLLAAPVVKGKTTYQAFIIVPGNSTAKSLSDLAGKPFVFSDKLSLTGYFFPVFSMHDSSGKAWSQAIFSSSQDQSINLVNRGVVAAGSVSGLVYDDVARRFPDRVRNTRVIQKSIEFGIPPIVVAPWVGGQIRDCLRDAFVEMHLSTEGRNILQSLGLDRFESVNEEQYESIEKMVPKTLSR